MITLSAAQVASAVSGQLSGLDPMTPITGPIVIDSRQVGPGSLFVALKGERVDGHDFAAQAIAAGAVCVLAERPIDSSSEIPVITVANTETALGDLAREFLKLLPDLTVIAVTGSVGKTTTKDLLAQVLAPLGPTVAPQGSFNNEVGMPLTVLSATPKTKYLVLEMGASGIGHLDYLTSIAVPDISVVLAVGRAHVGEFGGIDAVARAKSELVTGTALSGTVILNASDERVAAMRELVDGRRVRMFGAGADVQARNIDISPSATASFDLVITDSVGQPKRAQVSLQLVGEHQVSNALAAATVALELGADIDQVVDSLSRAQPLSYGRMALVQRDDGVKIINDAYNANPDSMAAALASLARIGSGGRTWAVLGEMRELGSDAKAGHFEVGQKAADLGIDHVLVVGQAAADIARGAFQGLKSVESVEVVADRAAASSVLKQQLRSGDVVLVKASNGAGLWQLGDELVSKREEN